MKKSIVALLAVTMLGSLSACGIVRSPGQFDEFAKCMTDKGFVMYHTETCPYCKAQRAAFKGSFDLIDSVECSQSPLDCMDAGIEGYPTWIYEGKKYPGKRSLSELAELSGCDLKDGVTGEDSSSTENAAAETDDTGIVAEPESTADDAVDTVTE